MDQQMSLVVNDKRNKLLYRKDKEIKDLESTHNHTVNHLI